MTNIHPTAVIDASAKLHTSVKVGPYSIIGPNVELGADCVLDSHVVVYRNTKIGKANCFYPFASVGSDSQSLHDNPEDETYLHMGDGNTVHEYCSINRGSMHASGKTVIGNNNLFMAYTHVAHDCVLGDNIVMVNNATLGGHVVIQDYAILSAFVAVRQYSTIGAHAFLIEASQVAKDVLPYVIVRGNPPRVVGINKVGLQRRGFTDVQIETLGRVYRTVFRQGLTAEQSVERLRTEYAQSGLVDGMLAMLETSERGIER